MPTNHHQVSRWKHYRPPSLLETLFGIGLKTAPMDF
jgi:hypothetical protein